MMEKTVLSFIYNYRVAYGDTDQMGYVYYGHYARIFEMARTEALRSIGLSYKTIEEMGIMMPVTNFTVRYVRPALYDDFLSVKVVVLEMPDRFMNFYYQVYNEVGEKLCEAETKLFFVDFTSRKPVRAPKLLLDKINVHS